MSMTRKQSKLHAGKVDTVAQQISVTPAREEKYKFSEIYAYNPYKLSVRADDDSINSVEDLKVKDLLVSQQDLKKNL